MPVKIDTTYKTLKRDWTIYRINLTEFTAHVHKQLTCTEEEVERERQRINKLVSRHDFGSAYVYRENTYKNDIIIPVL